MRTRSEQAIDRCIRITPVQYLMQIAGGTSDDRWGGGPSPAPRVTSAAMAQDSTVVRSRRVVTPVRDRADPIALAAAIALS